MAEVEVTATRGGRALIKAWQEATERRRRAEMECTSAQNALSDATTALAAWLAPKDAKPGERFGIWEQDRHGNEMLFEVVIGDHTREIKMRRR